MVTLNGVSMGNIQAYQMVLQVFVIGEKASSVKCFRTELDPQHKKSQVCLFPGPGRWRQTAPWYSLSICLT